MKIKSLKYQQSTLDQYDGIQQMINNMEDEIKMYHKHGFRLGLFLDEGIINPKMVSQNL